MSEAPDSIRTIISTAGEKGLPAVLLADRENVVALIAGSDRGTEIFFEPLEMLDATFKSLLLVSLTAAADFVSASIADRVSLRECRYVRSSLAARVRGSLRRLRWNRQHILEKAHAGKDGAGLFVGVRKIGAANAAMEVIFAQGLLESLLNANGKARLVEALRRAAYVVQCRHGSRNSGAA